MTKRIAFLLGTVLSLSLATTEAKAHWCNDLWGSAYNIVVRPASDTVTVPSSGAANLDIFVQNNMGYLLPKFVLKATATGATITVSRQTQKVANTLMPGEKAKFTLAVSKSGGGSVAVGDITFGVTFGDSGQSGLYPTSPGKAVMIRKTDGTLVPSPPPPPGIGTGNSQARQMQAAAVADFSNVDTGLDKLMNLYCAGRKSWGSDDDSVIGTACSGTATDCTKASRTVSSSVGSKFDYTKLWAAVELAARKGSLGVRAATLRTRLQCGASDANTAFAGLAMLVMGYLGDDPDARTFLEGKTSASGDLGSIAKAALVLMGDKTKYAADMTAGLKASSKFVQAACAAAVGIANQDDASVNSVLIPLVAWDEPDVAGHEIGLFASHLLAMVAWDRRGWAANAGDKGPVSFYPETGAGGSTGTAGTTGTPTGGTTAVPPPAGSTSSGGAKGGAVSSGSTVPPAGGSVAPPAGNSTPGSSVKGGNTPPVGGNTPPASSGTSKPPVGGETGAAGKTTTIPGAAGNSGSVPVPTAGNGGSDQGGENPGTAGGEGGASGIPGTGTASKGSAGGCNYGSTAPSSLGFLLSALGLALALRRRR
jgi:MYXO-CTERM domain-containing protein